MKFKFCTDNLRNKIFNYLLLLAICFIFSLFLDYYIGATLLLALIMLPILSTVLTLLGIRSINISFLNKKLICDKGEIVENTVNITSPSLIPIMYFSLVFKHSSNLVPIDAPNHTIALDKYSPSSIHLNYKTSAGGYAKIWIDDIIISDLTGWITFKAIDISEQYFAEVGIIPQIQPIIYNPDIINQSSNIFDGEDNVDVSQNHNTQSGIAGYDHRAYTPGDPLKRINWKLSAKTGEYMVRLDEPVTLHNHILLLDPRTGGDIYLDDRIIEGALTLINNIIRNNEPVELFLYENSNWSKYCINTLTDLETFRNRLSMYSFCPADDNPFNSAPLLKELNIILFTSYTSDINFIKNLISEYNITIITSAETASLDLDLLYIDLNLDIRRAL